MKIILGGIDVGVENLAFGLADVGNDQNPWELEKVTLLKRVNIQNLRHERIPPSECQLHHTRHICDLVDHFVQEYDPHLRSAKKLLIEQQPPGGLTNVEALLYKEYRESAILMSPTGMHHFFGIQHCDYEQRKEETIKIALQMLETNLPLKAKFERWIEAGIRVHDISDALAYIEMYRRQKEQEWKQQQSLKRPHTTTTGVIIDWEKYKYQPKKIRKSEG
jgi:hypothetical protein